MPRTRAQRAQQFQSFDALKGFREILKKQEIVVVPKKILSEDDYELLNQQVHQIKVGMMIRVVYYCKGQYLQMDGRVSKLNLDTQIIQIVKTKLSLRDIVEIEFL